MTVSKEQAPWPDFNGLPINHGDRLVHPDGSEFVAVKLPGYADDSDAWRAIYDGESVPSRLSLQIGGKGKAIVRQFIEQSQDSGHAGVSEPLFGVNQRGDGQWAAWTAMGAPNGRIKPGSFRELSLHATEDDAHAAADAARVLAAPAPTQQAVQQPTLTDERIDAIGRAEWGILYSDRIRKYTRAIEREVRSLLGAAPTADHWPILLAILRPAIATGQQAVIQHAQRLVEVLTGDERAALVKLLERPRPTGPPARVVHGSAPTPQPELTDERVLSLIKPAMKYYGYDPEAMREFGVCWQAAPEARMLTDAEVESTLDEAKVPEYPNCDDIDQQIAAVIQRRFCEVNGISLSGAKTGRLG